MASVTDVRSPAKRGAASDAPRKFGPLVAMPVVLLLAVFVLPSALTLPQSNPQETLEYAPVPPEDDESPPQIGNLAALGLGTSSGISGDGALGGDGPGGLPAPPPLPDPGGGVAIDPGTRCVGQPPRQTQDPLSPPCVPSFDGDNFGATYGMGVTGEEIKLLVYLDGGINYSSGSDTGNTTAPSDELFDLNEPPDPQDGPEHLVIKGLRSWQQYFNERFQTYNRFVHFYVYLTGSRTPEQRRADAAMLLEEVGPFAVVSFASEDGENDFLTAMARKGVLNFGSFGLRTAAFFNEFPNKIWSYLPTVEQQAESYVAYVCKKVVGQNSVLAGPALNGRPRKLGILHTGDERHPGLLRLAQLVRQGVSDCGGKIEAEAIFPDCCLAQDGGDSGDYASTQMADFQQKQITTILWAGGMNGKYGRASVSIGYFPEWVLLGDGLLDAYGPHSDAEGTNASVSFDRHAVVVTPQVLEPGLEQQRCFQAFREVNPDLPRPDTGYVCQYYKNLFQFFVGVQVAGPRLTPTKIDEGFHSIPQQESGSPTSPACFYEVDDYSCIKDAHVAIWDAQGDAPGADPDRKGCWRVIEGGQRYFHDTWPAGNIDAQLSPDFPAREPCNGYSRSFRYNRA